MVDRNTYLINLLAKTAADHAIVLFELTSKCAECGNPATVVNKLRLEKQGDKALRCDHCAAQSVHDNLYSEDDWHDLPHAESLRRVIDHYDAISILDPQVPALDKRH